MIGYNSLEPESNLIATAVRGVGADGRDLSSATCGLYNRQGERYPHGGETRSEVPCVTRFLKTFRIDDGDEFHFGLEYLFGRRSNLALRLGAWLDPDHQLYYDFEDRDPDDLQPEDRFRPAISPRTRTRCTGPEASAWCSTASRSTSPSTSPTGREIFSLSSVYRFR